MRLNGSGSVMAHQGDGIVANYNASDSTRDNVVYQQMRIRLNAGDMLTLPVSSTDNISIRAGDTSQKFNISIIT